MTSNPGGKETFIISAMQALSNDFECYFLADQDIAFQDVIAEAGGTVLPIPPRGKSPVKYLMTLARLIRKYRFDVIWLNQTVVNSFEPLLLGLFLGVQTRILHSHAPANMGRKLTGVLHQIGRHLAPLFTTHKFACAVAAGKWFFGNKKFTVVPNMFKVTNFTFSDAKRSEIRDELGVTQDERVIVQVGHFGPVKNHAFSVEILEALRQVEHSYRLVFVGQGPLEQEVRDKVRELALDDQVTFLGVRNDVSDILSGADALVLPSQFEGLGYALLEAQASGLPSFASDVVPREVQVSSLVHFLSLQEPALHWAGEIDAKLTKAATQDRSHNPLTGTEYDVDSARDYLMNSIR